MGMRARMASNAWWIHSLARGDGPGADQHAAVAVGEQSEGAAVVALVGPRAGDRLGDRGLQVLPEHSELTR